MFSSFMNANFFSCHVGTQLLVLRNRTTDTIIVSYAEGLWDNKIIARSTKRGRFLGSCNKESKVCTVDGLPPGVEYEIWVRHCTGPMYCSLSALPLKLATIPARKIISHIYLFKPAEYQ